MDTHYNTVLMEPKCQHTLREAFSYIFTYHYLYFKKRTIQALRSCLWNSQALKSCLWWDRVQAKKRKQSRLGQHVVIILSEMRTNHPNGLKNCKYFSSDWQFLERILQVGYFLQLNYYTFRLIDRWIMDR